MQKFPRAGLASCMVFAVVLRTLASGPFGSERYNIGMRVCTPVIISTSVLFIKHSLLAPRGALLQITCNVVVNCNTYLQKDYPVHTKSLFL